MFKKILMTMTLFTVIISFSYSQEIKFSGTLTGVGWVKTEHSKRITLFSYYDFSYEKEFMDTWSWRVGLGASNLQYEGITNASVGYFRERTYLDLPIIVRKYYTLSRYSVTYVEFGIINKYELTDKIDYDSDIKTDDKFKLGGYLADMSASAGFKTRFGKGYAMDLGFGGQKNAFASYKKNENKIKPSATFLTLSFSKKLERAKKTKK